MKVILNIFIAVVIASQAGAAFACSCRRAPLESVYKDSNHVYIAEVVAIEQNSKVLRHNEFASYTATFKRQRVFKGSPKEFYKIKFVQRHYEKSAEDFQVGGCELSFEIGDKYLILRKFGEKIQPSWCSPRIPHLDIIDMGELERIASGS